MGNIKRMKYANPTSIQALLDSPVGRRNREVIEKAQGKAPVDYSATAIRARNTEKLKPKARIRQSSKPLLNKLETRYLLYLGAQRDTHGCFVGRIESQAVKFKLGNGVTFQPDFFCFDWPWVGENSMPTAWDVKGPHAWEDSIVKLKVFATQYPEIRVVLAWWDKDGMVWREQRILA